MRILRLVRGLATSRNRDFFSIAGIPTELQYRTTIEKRGEREREREREEEEEENIKREKKRVRERVKCACRSAVHFKRTD